MAQDFDRFRSFAERYVVARAPTFDPKTEQEDAWEALLNARTIYEQIGQMSKNVDTPDTQQMLAGAATPLSAAGMNRPQYPRNLSAKPQATPIIRAPSLTHTSMVKRAVQSMGSKAGWW